MLSCRSRLCRHFGRHNFRRTHLGRRGEVGGFPICIRTWLLRSFRFRGLERNGPCHTEPCHNGVIGSNLRHSRDKLRRRSHSYRYSWLCLGANYLGTLASSHPWPMERPLWECTPFRILHSSTSFSRSLRQSTRRKHLGHSIGCDSLWLYKTWHKEYRSRWHRRGRFGRFPPPRKVRRWGKDR